MKQADLVCKTNKKFRLTTDSKHNLPISSNLLTRQFTVNEPNRVYVVDINYILTREGWIYLATVIDLFSQTVVGWTMDSRMTSVLVNNALLMALWRRKSTSGLNMAY